MFCLNIIGNLEYVVIRVFIVVFDMLRLEMQLGTQELFIFLVEVNEFRLQYLNGG